MNEQEILKTLNNEINSHINISFDDIRKGYDNKMKKNKIKTFTLGLVASFAFFSTAAFGVYYYTPQTYVSIDINPSIELQTNFADKVIGANGANDDAIEVLSSVDIRNKPIDEAIKTIVEETVEQGYITEEKENAVLITVSTDDEEKSETIDNKVKKCVNEVLVKTNQQAEVVDVVTKKNQQQVKQKAEELGISVGKANVIDNIIRKSKDIDEDVLTFEELKDLPVKEIVHLYKSNKYKDKNIIDEVVDNLEDTEEEDNEKVYIGKEKTKYQEKYSNKNNNNNSNRNENAVKNKNKIKEQNNDIIVDDEKEDEIIVEDKNVPQNQRQNNNSNSNSNKQNNSSNSNKNSSNGRKNN